eukprot:6491193-Amphidinium_carterae.3
MQLRTHENNVKPSVAGVQHFPNVLRQFTGAWNLVLVWQRAEFPVLCQWSFLADWIIALSAAWCFNAVLGFAVSLVVLLPLTKVSEPPTGCPGTVSRGRCVYVALGFTLLASDGSSASFAVCSCPYFPWLAS